MTRIVDYDLYQVPPRWLFLRIETSDGRVGWGDPVVEGRARTVETAVEELLDTYLLGEDPAPIEDHWQTMYRSSARRSTTSSAAPPGTGCGCTSGSAGTGRKASPRRPKRKSRKGSQP